MDAVVVVEVEMGLGGMWRRRGVVSWGCCEVGAEAMMGLVWVLKGTPV